MLPLFPVQNGKLIKNREFVELIGCEEVRFQAPIFFLEKKCFVIIQRTIPNKKIEN